MSIIDLRLQQIANIKDQIDEKNSWIKKKKDELEEELNLIKTIPEELADLISRSASSATKNRRLGDTIEIKEAAQRNQEIVEELEDAVKKGEEELEELEKEKRALEDFVRGI